MRSARPPGIENSRSGRSASHGPGARTHVRHGCRGTSALTSQLTQTPIGERRRHGGTSNSHARNARQRGVEISRRGRSAPTGPRSTRTRPSRPQRRVGADLAAHPNARRRASPPRRHQNLTRPKRAAARRRDLAPRPQRPLQGPGALAHVRHAHRSASALASLLTPTAVGERRRHGGTRTSHARNARPRGVEISRSGRSASHGPLAHGRHGHRGAPPKTSPLTLTAIGERRRHGGTCTSHAPGARDCAPS